MFVVTIRHSDIQISFIVEHGRCMFSSRGILSRHALPCLPMLANTISLMAMPL